MPFCENFLKEFEEKTTEIERKLKELEEEKIQIEEDKTIKLNGILQNLIPDGYQILSSSIFKEGFHFRLIHRKHLMDFNLTSKSNQKILYRINAVVSIIDEDDQTFVGAREEVLKKLKEMLTIEIEKEKNLRLFSVTGEEFFEIMKYKQSGYFPFPEETTQMIYLLLAEGKSEQEVMNLLNIEENKLNYFLEKIKRM